MKKKVTVGCLEGVQKVSGVWNVCERCLKYVWKVQDGLTNILRLLKTASRPIKPYFKTTLRLLCNYVMTNSEFLKDEHEKVSNLLRTSDNLANKEDKSNNPNTRMSIRIRRKKERRSGKTLEFRTSSPLHCSDSTGWAGKEDQRTPGEDGTCSQVQNQTGGVDREPTQPDQHLVRYTVWQDSWDE